MAKGSRAVADADEPTERPANSVQAFVTPTIDVLALFSLTVTLALLAVVLF